MLTKVNEDERESGGEVEGEKPLRKPRGACNNVKSAGNKEHKNR